MTLHDLALDWVSQVTNGIITHKGIGPGKKVYSVEAVEPDVVVNRSKPPSCHVWHEVEVVPFRKSKLDTYMRHKQRKILWLVLPKGVTDVFSIKLIEHCEDTKFKLVPWTGRRL